MITVRKSPIHFNYFIISYKKGYLALLVSAHLPACLTACPPACTYINIRGLVFKILTIVGQETFK
jgi:hypothetical protein